MNYTLISIFLYLHDHTVLFQIRFRANQWFIHFSHISGSDGVHLIKLTLISPQINLV